MTDLASRRRTEQLSAIAKRVASRRRVAGWSQEDSEQEAWLCMLSALKETPDLTLSQLENLALDHLKSVYREANRRKEEQDDEEETVLQGAPGREPEPLAKLISDELRDRLPDLLSDREFQVIRALFWEYATEEDVAKEFAISADSVKKTKRRALKKLSEKLSGF